MKDKIRIGLMVLLGLVFLGMGISFLIYDLGFLGVIWCGIGIMVLVFAIKCGHDLWLVFQGIKNNLPAIESNFSKIKKKLKDSDFNTDEHYSSFGYAYIEYRNYYNARDNVHIEIDREKNLISYYMLLPFKFILKSFEQIEDVRIVTNKTINRGRYLYDMIAIFIKFEGEKDEVAFSVCDNTTCYEGDENCTRFLQDAEKFKTILLSLKEEN